MPQRVVVTGATGLLGRQVLKAFDAHSSYEVIGLGFSRATDKVRRLDIRDEDAVKAFFDEVKPRVVIHCAANRQPDSCTSDPAAALQLNNDATAILDRACTTHSAFLLYISTDYVFPGIKGEAPYASTHPPSPPNTYGETKREGETTTLSPPTDTTKTKNTAILRVPVLYGETQPHENNAESAVNVILDNLWRANKSIDQTTTVKMDDWAIRYPTNTLDAARVIVDIAQIYADESPGRQASRAAKERYAATRAAAADGISDHAVDGLPRILHFSSEDPMTKYEICAVFAEVMGLSMEKVVRDTPPPPPPSPPTTASASSAADGRARATVRPYDCHLSTVELKRLGVDLRTVDFTAWWRRYVGAFRR